MRAATDPAGDPSPALQPLCISVTDAASAIGIGRTRMWDLIREGRVPAVRINHRVLIRTADLEQFIRSLPPFGTDAA